MGNANYVRYAPGSYSNIPTGFVRVLAEKKVGRNGWPVMVALCSCVLENRMIGRMLAASISERTGLSLWQVARGMAELRNKGIVMLVIRRAEEGYRRIDRSNTGHVARYCFTSEVWNKIETESDLSENA